MSTPEMSDDELEALFQRGFEHFPEERSLAEWWHLEEKLQAQALEQQVRRRVRRVLAAELLLLSLSALLWLTWPAPPARQPLPATGATGATAPAPARSGQPQPRARHATPTVALAAPAQNQHPALAAPDALAQTAQPSGALAADGIPRAAAPAVAAPAVAAPGAAAEVTDSDPGTVGRSQAGPFWSPEQARARRAAGSRRALAARPLTRPLSPPPARHRAAPTYQSAESRRAQPVALLLPPVSNGEPRPAAPPAADAATVTLAAPALAGSPPANELLTGVVAQVTRPALTPVPALLAGQPAAAAANLPPPLPAAPAYRLSLALVGTSELSAVRFARLMPPGQAAGLQVEYRLTARLRLSTGVLRANQVFDARGSDYRPAVGTGPAGATLVWVSGTAQLLDFPLDLRYNVLVRPRYGLFASAGLSSVLLRGEQYHCDYLVNGQPEQREMAQTSGAWQPLSTLNLSVGYERALGQGPWSVQAVPFVKLPLNGIGMGRVMMGSAGVQLALKYGLLPVRVRR